MKRVQMPPTLGTFVWRCYTSYATDTRDYGHAFLRSTASQRAALPPGERQRAALYAIHKRILPMSIRVQRHRSASACCWRARQRYDATPFSGHALPSFVIMPPSLFFAPLRRALRVVAVVITPRRHNQMSRAKRYAMGVFVVAAGRQAGEGRQEVRQARGAGLGGRRRQWYSRQWQRSARRECRSDSYIEMKVAGSAAQQVRRDYMKQELMLRG